MALLLSIASLDGRVADGEVTAGLIRRPAKTRRLMMLGSFPARLELFARRLMLKT